MTSYEITKNQGGLLVALGSSLDAAKGAAAPPASGACPSPSRVKPGG